MRDLICKFQRENEAFSEVYAEIKPCLKRYSMYLQYDCAESDLVIYLYMLLKKLDLTKFKDDSLLEHYINRCLKREYLRLRYSNFIDNKVLIDTDLVNTEINLIATNVLDTERFDFMELIASLDTIDKRILIYRYYYLLGDSEIAKKLNISRQAVHKRRNNSLNHLKTMYGKGSEN